MKKMILQIRKAVLIVAAMISLLTFPCPAQELSSIPSSIHTPEQIVKWLSSEFKYQMKLPDKPQSLNETLTLKTGDCDDFATLAAAVLARSGIKSDIIVIKYRALNIMHAVCMFKDKDGTYSFISNTELHRTHKSSITSAIAEYYPDYEKIMISSGQTGYMETVASSR